MIRRLLLFAALVAATPVLARAQDSSAAKIPMDRVVAIVGTQPILWSEVLEIINQRRAQGMPVPDDTLAQLEMARTVVGELVDEEVLVQRARNDTSVTVADADVAATVDQQIKKLREQFKTDKEYNDALKSAGFGNMEEYRRWLTEQSRRRALSQKMLQKMQQAGRMIAVSVSEADITESFEKNKTQLPKRPAAITFRQIVVQTTASQKAKLAARLKAESLLVEVQRGGDFASIAKRESMDQASKELGGDLGWNRRETMVPAFANVMFALNPGQVSPVVETTYGYHIIKVDRVKPAEVKARHILIKPAYDSTDVQRARQLADSILQRWKAGVPYDTLVRRFHDPDELSGSQEPFPREQLPESYKTALKDITTPGFFGPFEIEDKQRSVPKFVVGQLIEVIHEGEYTVKDLREQIRSQLQQEKSFRRLLDTLRKETYVSIRLDGASLAP
jgi:peptidyl-prolyl cis-trans isomerase SurA